MMNMELYEFSFFLLDNLSALFFTFIGRIPFAQTGLGFLVSVTHLEFALRERDCL